MDLRQLRYFVAVAEERHFGRAAARLHMAQPPLSQAIRQLEGELGVTLLHRTTRRVDLTDAGAAYLERARAILAEVDEAAQHARRIAAGAVGHLTIGCVGSATYSLLPALSRHLSAELPGIDFSFRGEMLAPGDGSDHVQVIDARDLARFTRRVVEEDKGGTFNLAGPRLTWSAFLDRLGARDLVWVPAEVIAAAGVTAFDLPLYRPEHGPRSGLMDVSHARARAAGLTLTDFSETLADVRRWLKGRPAELTFSAEREAELIRQARQRATDAGRA